MVFHKECNPEMVGKNSHQGGLRIDEWKDQMGLSQSDLLTLQESIQAAQSSDSRRFARSATTTANTPFAYSTVHHRNPR